MKNYFYNLNLMLIVHIYSFPTASALSLAADGSSRVQVQDGAQLRYVVVKPGLAADGFVEVTPSEGKLEPGQLVVVGYNEPKAKEPK